MEISKERKAFEAWYEQHHNGRQIACDYVEEDNSYSVGYANAIWVGWQAVKATPEGFVLELEKGRFVQYELIDLLTRSLNSSKVLKTNTNWVHVVRMLNVGSTVAHRICEKLGVDP